MPHLFDPLRLRSVTLRNRIGVSPMCQYCGQDGMPTDWHLVHLGSRAAGGAGLVFVEATAVRAEGRITPGCLGIWSDAHVAPFERIARFVKGQGAVSAIQIAHAGRKASCDVTWKGSGPLSDEEGGWEIIAPSAVPFNEKSRVPREMTLEDIAEVQEAFRQATLRSKEAGFEWLEVHGAHGYLMHSFHSPISNKRTDNYGGSFKNRVRFTVDTVRIVREAWPEEKPMSVRLSSTDWYEGGWTLAETIELAKILRTLGVDLIDCSGGGGTPLAKVPVGAGYQVPFAEAVRREAEVPTAAVGMITEPWQADQIIRNGRADIVLLAREMLREPYWPQHAAALLGKKDLAYVPDPYHRAHGR